MIFFQRKPHFLSSKFICCALASEHIFPYNAKHFSTNLGTKSDTKSRKRQLLTWIVSFCRTAWNEIREQCKWFFKRTTVKRKEKAALPTNSSKWNLTECTSPLGQRKKTVLNMNHLFGKQKHFLLQNFYSMATNVLISFNSVHGIDNPLLFLHSSHNTSCDFETGQNEFDEFQTSSGGWKWHRMA